MTRLTRKGWQAALGSFLWCWQSGLCPSCQEAMVGPPACPACLAPSRCWGGKEDKDLQKPLGTTSRCSQALMLFGGASLYSRMKKDHIFFTVNHIGIRLRGQLERSRIRQSLQAWCCEEEEGLTGAFFACVA